MALTAMRIKKGRLHGGFYLGSGDRAEAISRYGRDIDLLSEAWHRLLQSEAKITAGFRAGESPPRRS